MADEFENESAHPSLGVPDDILQVRISGGPQAWAFVVKDQHGNILPCTRVEFTLEASDNRQDPEQQAKLTVANVYIEADCYAKVLKEAADYGDG